MSEECGKNIQDEQAWIRVGQFSPIEWNVPDEWSKQAHDENSDLLADGLHKLFQPRNLRNRGRDGADNIVTELQDWVDWRCQNLSLLGSN